MDVSPGISSRETGAIVLDGKSYATEMTVPCTRRANVPEGGSTENPPRIRVGAVVEEGRWWCCSGGAVEKFADTLRSF